MQETPSAISKKRELSSPEFSLDKKNKPSASASSVSDISDISLTEQPGEMASETTESQELSSTPHITIPPSEMLKLSEMLKDTFRGEIVAMVDSVVQGVLKGLNDKIASLEEKNKILETENNSLRAQISGLENKAEQAEQYSRRNNLRISGCPESNAESTDEIVLKMAADIGTDLRIEEIDRSHRVGKFDPSRSRPREIIVKFTSYRARQKLLKMRSALKDNGYVGVFLNEDLTKHRSAVLFEARKAVKSDTVKGAWSSDGNILIRDHNDKIHRVYSLNDITAINFPPKPMAVIESAASGH